MFDALLLTALITLLIAATVIQAVDVPRLTRMKRVLPFAIGPLLVIAGIVILLQLSTYL
jgi:hypothetical protein